MVAAFPAAKLGALLIKQIAKPIANAVKSKAKSSPVFRKYVCMPPAQFYNWCEVQAKMWILNLGKPVNIPVLSEAMAIELGASLLGEGIIFAIAAGILIAEYNRGARKEEKKEQQIQEEKLELFQTIQELYFLTQKQGTQIKELSRMVYDLEGRVVQKPWASKKEPSHDFEKPSFEPPPPFGGASTYVANNKVEIEPNENNREVVEESKIIEHHNNLILSAVANLETQFWKSTIKDPEPSLVDKAINHIFKEVYRLPITVGTGL